MMIGGAACARSMPFLWGGSRWSTKSFSGSGGEEWQTSFVLRTASSEASQILRRLHRRGSCRGLRPSGCISWIPSEPYAHWSVMSTLSVSARSAPRRIEEALPERERETLGRALRARPQGSDPLSVVDYLYLAQLPVLLFSSDVWHHARLRLGAAQDGKQRLQTAVATIAPVRNEIAHVREVDRERLLRASVACNDVLEMLKMKNN